MGQLDFEWIRGILVGKRLPRVLQNDSLDSRASICRLLTDDQQQNLFARYVHHHIISRCSPGPSSRGYVYPQGMPPRKPSKETRMKRQSSTKWAPTWRTRHAPEKVGSKDAFCAEFEHVSEGQQVRVYIHTRDLNKFWNARQKRDQAHVEQVLRAVLECYVNEKGHHRGISRPKM